MAESFMFVVEGIKDLQEYSASLTDIQFTAVQAINKVARDARSDAAKMIAQQVNFPSSYLNPAQKRLFVSQQAKRGRLEAKIFARGRPTSLARFITSAPTKANKGIRFEVTPGRPTFMRRAFLIKLRAGSDSIETRFNRGLAIRLKPGESLTNKKVNLVRHSSGIYVLYGPSVSQILLNNDNTGVAADLEPQILDELESEIERLFDLRKK